MQRAGGQVKPDEIYQPSMHYKSSHHANAPSNIPQKSNSIFQKKLAQSVTPQKLPSATYPESSQQPVQPFQTKALAYPNFSKATSNFNSQDVGQAPTANAMSPLP